MYSFDEIRSYLDNTGADQEADQWLSQKIGSSSPTKLKTRTEAYKLSNDAKNIKESIMDQRQKERDELINLLVTEKHAGALGAIKEADEIRQLTALESQLREDSLQMESSSSVSPRVLPCKAADIS